MATSVYWNNAIPILPTVGVILSSYYCERAGTKKRGLYAEVALKVKYNHWEQIEVVMGIIVADHILVFIW